jgi:chromosome segregation ATPase
MFIVYICISFFILNVLFQCFFSSLYRADIGAINKITGKLHSKTNKDHQAASEHLEKIQRRLNRVKELVSTFSSLSGGNADALKRANAETRSVLNQMATARAKESARAKAFRTEMRGEIAKAEAALNKIATRNEEIEKSSSSTMGELLKMVASMKKDYRRMRLRQQDFDTVLKSLKKSLKNSTAFH